jgi:hypothetical protein
VLKVLPFTTINLTELADWKPASGTQIVVSNNDFRTTLTSDTPVRGKVVPGSKPTTSTVTNAIASIRKSNSGVAVMGGGIDDDDEAVLTDFQPFQPDGSWGGSDTDAGSGGSFSVTLSSYTVYNANPTFGVSPTATCNPATSGTTQPNPFTCTTQYTGQAQALTIGNYNYQIDGTSSAPLSCSGKDGAKTYPGTSYVTRVCRNYAVTAVSKNNTALSLSLNVSNEGSTEETTTINFTNVANGDALGITFGAPTDTTQTTYCSYSGNGSQLNQYQVATADCP